MYLDMETETICQWENCNMTFKSQNNCYDHVRQVHVLKNTLVCKWNGCHKVCSIRSNLTNHMLKHLQIVSGVCYVCERVFKWRGDSKKHLMRHSQTDRKFNDAVSILFK